jgi:probable HAF family extracellular repeat protein
MRSRLSPTRASHRRPAAVPAVAMRFRALAAGLLALFVAAGPCAPPAAAVGYTVTDLGLAWTMHPMAMSNSGQVVGPLPAVPNAQGAWSIFLDDATGVHDLGEFVAGPGSPGLPAFVRTRGVNDAGQIVGDAEMVTDPGPSPTHAFLYDGTVHDLCSPIDGDYSSAAAINDAAHVAVEVWDPRQISATGIPEYVYHAFFYDGARQRHGRDGQRRCR